MHKSDYSSYAELPSADPEALRQAMRQWASGVTVVTAEHDGERYGITASSFASISLEPPVVMVAVNNQSSMAQAVISAEHYSVHLLSSDQQELSGIFASPIPGSEKFNGIDTQIGSNDAPTIEGALAVLECILQETLVVGTHTVMFGRVVGASSRPEAGSPLLYYHRGYRTLNQNNDPGR